MNRHLYAMRTGHQRLEATPVPRDIRQKAHVGQSSPSAKRFAFPQGEADVVPLNLLLPGDDEPGSRQGIHKRSMCPLCARYACILDDNKPPCGA